MLDKHKSVGNIDSLWEWHLKLPTASRNIQVMPKWFIHSVQYHLLILYYMSTIQDHEPINQKFYTEPMKYSLPNKVHAGLFGHIRFLNTNSQNLILKLKTLFGR